MKKVIQWKEKGGQIKSSNLSTFLTKTYECQKNGWELKNTKRLFSVWIEISISFRKTKKVEQAFKKKPNMAFSFFISTNLQNVWSCNGMEISWENFLWRFRFEWNNKRGFLLFSFFTFGGYLAFDQRGCFNSSSFLSFSFKTSHPTPLFRHLLDSLVGKSLSFLATDIFRVQLTFFQKALFLSLNGDFMKTIWRLVTWNGMKEGEKGVLNFSTKNFLVPWVQSEAFINQFLFCMKLCLTVDNAKFYIKIILIHKYQSKAFWKNDFRPYKKTQPCHALCDIIVMQVSCNQNC